MVEVSLEKCATAKGLDLELDQASFKLKMVLDGTTCMTSSGRYRIPLTVIRARRSSTGRGGR